MILFRFIFFLIRFEFTFLYFWLNYKTAHGVFEGFPGVPPVPRYSAKYTRPTTILSLHRHAITSVFKLCISCIFISLLKGSDS